MTAPRGKPPLTREQISMGSILEGGVGNARETAIIEELDSELRAAGSEVCIIPGEEPPFPTRWLPGGNAIDVIQTGFDFVRSDVAFLDARQDAVVRPFPRETPVCSYERLAWAMDHQHLCEAVLCDVKTGPPTIYWLESKSGIYITQLAGLPNDRMYLIPPEMVRFMRCQLGARRRMDRRYAAQFSHPILGPYAVFRKEYVAMLERLVLGPGTDADAFRSAILNRSHRLAEGSKVKLSELFQFQFPLHEQSFKCVWKLYRLHQRCHSKLRFHRIPTQPLGGDFVIECDDKRFVIQHKMGRFSEAWFKPPAHFHFLFVHGGLDHESDELDGQLSVYYAKDKETRFDYNESGMRELEAYLRTHADAASRRLHAASIQIIHEKVALHHPAAEEEEGARLEVAEYSTFRKRAHRAALLFCDLVNKDLAALNLPVACVYMNWDQTHPFGEVLVTYHAWTPEERRNVRERDLLPASLEFAACLSADHRGIVLRFCCRNYRNRVLRSQHLPLQQRGAELPTTSQKFFLVAVPDGAMPGALPSSLLFLPSEFITFPSRVHEVWQKSESMSQQCNSLYTLSLLYGHATSDAGFQFDMIPDVRLADFWITPSSVVEHLCKILRGSGTLSIAHPEVRSAGRSFAVDDYLTDTRTVLHAPLDYGLMRVGDGKDYRAEGWYGDEQQRKRASAQARV
jgi:hypothetical protein